MPKYKCNSLYSRSKGFDTYLNKWEELKLFDVKISNLINNPLTLLFIKVKK